MDGIARANDKRGPERDRSADDRGQRLEDLEQIKTSARERLRHVQETQLMIATWCRERFEIAKADGDVQEVARLTKLLNDCATHDLKVLGRSLAGRPAKSDGGDAEAVSEEGRAGLLDAYAPS